MKIILGRVKVTVSFWFIGILTLMFVFFDEIIIASSLASSFFHEMGHIFFMCLLGLPPDNIHFGFFGMRIKRKSGTVNSYAKEILISLGGIIFNFILIMLFYSVYMITDNTIYCYFAVVNVLIISVNSFPVEILDAGRALKYFFMLRYDEELSEKIIDRISFFSICIFVAVFIFYSFYKGINFSLVALIIYLISATSIKKRS